MESDWKRERGLLHGAWEFTKYTDEQRQDFVNYAATRREAIEQQAARWIEHSQMRLEYERALLDAFGGDEFRQAQARVEEKKQSARKAKTSLPIVNDPGSPKHITSEEWNKTYADYKGLKVMMGAYRERQMLYREVGKGMVQSAVYLTDKKQVLISEIK